MIRNAKIALLILGGMLVASCSPYMALHQPGRMNLGVLREGTPQSNVRVEFGTPVWTGKDDQGSDVDIYRFVQGYSGGAKAARFVWHAAADVFSIGLWEIFGTPIESHFSGTKMNAVVTYDEQQKVKSIKLQDADGKAILFEDPHDTTSEE
ncbi:hypothetical protein MELA_02312 [Candidatus Methylomirabilis lanthanidiphila]|uniref:Lipoprotein n=1 Tax=Candidatus Methylomirabilis lanthanidiphila TaxID=2211376 RepID=A0A564ZKR6_9BACT|nr:hypothetical protein [Candidatus Methylomirabilis lanthanidiphila]VUZ85925.1 hypothetical protein MELA_02312 [Candidatus Methylomirabilis lanthanidiphila]